ncbi:MAG TPA: restriction endonuclease subunit S [Planctomycetota bacterium]|nr:restriction endonuclease subunit S [Planctomycetota bacterium]
MALKPGYKQTDVGVLPEEWEVRSLASLAERIMVGIASAATHAYRARGVVMFRNQNIKPGYLDDGDLLFVDPTYEKPFKNKRLRGGDLLTARTGYPGTSCVVPLRYESAQSFTTLITRPNTAVIDSSFLCHYVNSEAGQKFFEQGQIGGAQKNVNAGTLRKMPVPMPRPTEQRAIAEALSDVDALLGALDRLIAKKRDLKQAAMQQLLTGQTRLPGFRGEWEVKRLGDVALLSKGTQLHSSETDEGGRFAHLNGGITPSSYTHKSNMAGNTIAISEGGNSCGFVQFMTEPYWCGGHCYSVIPNGIDNHFLYHALKGQQSAIMALRVGSGLPNVQKSGLLGFKLRSPATLPEQTAIAAVLGEMDAELAASEQRRDKTRDLKQGMMQELLTGRIRLV